MVFSLTFIYYFPSLRGILQVGSCWQDFGTQVYHSRAYQKACKEKGVKPGRFVTPELGEFMAGLYLSFLLVDSL